MGISNVKEGLYTLENHVTYNRSLFCMDEHYFRGIYVNPTFCRLTNLEIGHLKRLGWVQISFQTYKEIEEYDQDASWFYRL